jgi:hypothetical protein
MLSITVMSQLDGGVPATSLLIEVGLAKATPVSGQPLQTSSSLQKSTSLQLANSSQLSVQLVAVHER